MCWLLDIHLNFQKPKLKVMAMALPGFFHSHTLAQSDTSEMIE